LGSKNRKLLGVITSLMLHHLRNIFDDKELYITKRKLTLIQEKHPKEFQYIKDDQFQKILDGTVANCELKEKSGV
jgi:hypothetical protein